MGIRIYLGNSTSAESSSIQCEIEPDEKVEGLIETAVKYWELDKNGKYAIKCGVELLTAGQTVSNANIKEGDKVVIVDPDKWSKNLETVKNWITFNLGGAADELELVSSEEEGSRSTKYVIRNRVTTDRQYEIIFDNNKVKSYSPL